MPDPNIEYKSSWHNDYLKWICFPMRKVEIYIGMNDATVVGVENQNADGRNSQQNQNNMELLLKLIFARG